MLEVNNQIGYTIIRNFAICDLPGLPLLRSYHVITELKSNYKTYANYTRCCMRKYFRKFWGTVPIILFLACAMCLYIIHTVFKITLTNTFYIVILWFGIVSLSVLLLWGSFQLNVVAGRKHGRIYMLLSTAIHVVTTGLFMGLFIIGVCASMLINNPTVYQSANNIRQDDSKDNAPNENENTNAVEVRKLDIGVMSNRENELVFTMSIDDFIDSYNGYFWESYNARGLTSYEEWNYMQCSHSINSPNTTDRYRFSYDYNSWSLPKITIDTTPDNSYILDIYLNLDDHSRTDGTYTQYKNMCFHTLKVFFPDFNDQKINDIFQQLTQLAYKNRYDSSITFDESIDIVPCAIYYQNGIGLYPYFLHGNCYLCVIPVNDEVIDSLAAKGAGIYRIDEEFP